MEDLLPWIEFEHMGVKDFLNTVVPSNTLTKGFLEIIINVSENVTCDPSFPSFGSWLVGLIEGSFDWSVGWSVDLSVIIS